MAFQWQAPGNPYAGSITDLMLRGPDALAQGALNAAKARAAATQQSGQIWGNAIAGAGNAVASGIQQANDPQRKLEDIKLADAQRTAAGQKVVAGAMEGGLNPGDAGPIAAQQFMK